MAPSAKHDFGSLLVVLGILGATVLGCSERKDLDGVQRPPSGARSEEPASPSLVANATAYLDFFGARAYRSDLDQGVLAIATWGADFWKYTDGGTRGWLHGGIVADTQGSRFPSSRIKGLGAEVHFPFDRDLGGIAARNEVVPIRFHVRSAVAKQLVSVFLNGTKLGDLPMSSAEWSWYQIDAPESLLRSGENKLRFYFQSTGTLLESRSAAAFHRIEIGATSADAEGEGCKAGEICFATLAGRKSFYTRLDEGDFRLRSQIRGSGQAQVWLRREGQSQEKLGSFELDGKTSVDCDLEIHMPSAEFVRIDFFSANESIWTEPRLQWDEEKRAPRKDKSQPASQRPKRIVLWSVSSLRYSDADLSQASVLRRFAAKSDADKQHRPAVLQASATFPTGSIASLMTGRSQIGALPPSAETMAEALQKSGYHTVLLSGNASITDKRGFSQGFDIYENPMVEHRRAPSHILWRRAKEIFKAHKGDHVFVHLVTTDSHLPYRPSDESLTRLWAGAEPFSASKTSTLAQILANGSRNLSPHEWDFVRALRNGTIIDTAVAFEHALSDLSEWGPESENAVFLVGDHGEELLERGHLGHGESLFQESLQTLLAIQWDQEIEVPHMMSTIDIFPTVMDLASLPEGRRSLGRSLLEPPAQSERAFFSRNREGGVALVWGHWKFIQDAFGEFHIYELSRDPREKDDRATNGEIRVRGLRTAAAVFRAYAARWSKRRWGQVIRPYRAFALDQGE